MGRVLTNFTSLAYAIESTPKVLPGSPLWKLTEPNDVTAYGAQITKTPRDPISKSRQRRKGTTTDLDSSVEYEADLTLESFQDHIEGFAFAQFNYPHVSAADQGPIRAGGTPFGLNLAADNDAPPAGTDAGYTHSAIAAAIPANTLVYARGFSITANNGLKVVIAGSTTTATLISTALTDETPAGVSGASLEIAGRRAATSDLAIVVTGSTAVLSSTVLNFTTLGLLVGQMIHVGGLLAANQFSAGFGFARVTSIAANALGLDHLDSTLATDPGTGDTVDLLFGRFLRNVDVDDPLFLERYFQFELALPDLAAGDVDAFYYSLGNLSNKVTFKLAVADKATVTFGFVGADTSNPTTTRKTNASTPVQPVATEALNCSSDVGRLRVFRIDQTGLTTCFTSADLSLDNQVSPEKCIGTLGATFLNTGNLLVDLDAEVLLTSDLVIAAIRDNETVGFDTILSNSESAIAIDIPSLTLGDGSLSLPRNESVKINLAGEAFKDASLGYSIGISTFPIVP